MRHFSGEFEGISLLMLDELDAIAGGEGEDTDDQQTPPPPNSDGDPNNDIIVNGVRYEPPMYFYPWYSGGGGMGGGGGDPSPPPPPDCHTSNAISNLTPPDNAKYYVPENVDQKYMIGALNHISSIYNNSEFNKPAVIAELYDMYTNPNNPYFVDFKDWGTPSGPTGSADGGTISYHSDVTGTDVTTDAFEPFGNYFYGFILTFGGLSPEEVYAVAALTQTGTGWIPQDDPRDTPHVTKGIADAQRYLADPVGTGAVFGVATGACS